MKNEQAQKIFGLLSVSIILSSMLGSLAVPARADSTGDYVPIKWAVIITGGFDYYRTSWYWSYNTIQRLENYMQGRGVPYDLIKDSDLESARDTPSLGRYPLQFADGTPRYQVLVLQTNDYSSVAVANKDLILQAVQNGTNAVLFGKALAVFPELFSLNPSDVLSDNWPIARFLTATVTKDFDDGVANGAYQAGAQISMGARTSHVECTTLDVNGKTVWFNFLRNGEWTIGMMNSTYGLGAVWFNAYDMSEPALEYTSQLNSTWVSSSMGFWAHAINFVLKSAEKISVHIMPFETWKGAWIIRTDRDSNSWRAPAPVEAFEAGWKYLEGFCVLGYGRVPNDPVTLHQGLPSGYVGVSSEKIMWADLYGVPKNDAYRTLVTYKIIVYNSIIGGSYDRIRIDFNNDFDFLNDAEYEVWDNITYPDIIGTLFWCYISPNFTNPASIGLGWKQTPILFDDDCLTALRNVGENYGNLYTFHSFYHFNVGYDYTNGGFLKWNGTEFVQDPTYVREQFEAARASMIQDFGTTGYGFESDNVVLHYSGNIFPMWVREVVGQIPWILYEIGGGAGPGGFYKASETTKWLLPCYGSESYETVYPTYIEAMQTLYPFMAVFQHDDFYNLNLNQSQMRPFTNDITIADATDVYNFFIKSRTMLQNVAAAYCQNGQVVLDFNAPSGLVDYTWVLPSTIDGNEYTGFSDSASVAALKSNDGQNIFIESSQGQGHQILTVNYGQPIPAVIRLTLDRVTCREYLETFSLQINVTNAVNVQAFAFTINYNPVLVNCSSITWGELGTGCITTLDIPNGIVEGNVDGSAISGNCWLLNLTFQAAEGLVWKQGLPNELEGEIWFHQAMLGFTDNETLQYVEGGVNQVNVNRVSYAFLPIRGDINNDGSVDLNDLRTVAAYYDTTSLDERWNEALKYDLNCDNAIDIFDLVVVASNFGFTYT